MTDFTKQIEQFSDLIKASVPTVTPNKNGYEIRTKVLEIAKEAVWNDYTAKWGQYETSVRREGDEIVTTVKMPTVPGADQVLEAAEKFYSFVNKR